MKQLLVCLVLVSLCACKSGQPEGKALEVIPLASAFENQTELKASDCFSRVRYVALETTDDCLVGDEPVVRIAPDKIIVMTSQRQCFAFDKQTGKFLYPIGHIGDDPGRMCRFVRILQLCDGTNLFPFQPISRECYL